MTNTAMKKCLILVSSIGKVGDYPKIRIINKAL